MATPKQAPKPAPKQPAAPVAAPADHTHRVVSPLRLDGKRYAIGDTLALPEHHAKALHGHTVLPLQGDDATDEA